MSTEALITLSDNQSEEVEISNNHFDMTNGDSMPGELHINCEDCQFSGMSFHGYKVVVNGKRVVVDSSYFDACKDGKSATVQVAREPYHETVTVKEIQYMISSTDWIIIVMLIVFVPKLSWKLLVKPIKGQWNKVRASWKETE